MNSSPKDPWRVSSSPNLTRNSSRRFWMADSNGHRLWRCAWHCLLEPFMCILQVDVYSFGMTLLELISGRRTVDLSLPSDFCFYAVWAYKELNRGQSMTTLVDERLNKESMDEGKLRRMLQVGLWCTQDDPEKRPTMRDVVKMLEGTLEVQDAPAPPSYAQTSDEGFHSGHAALFQHKEKIVVIRI